MTPRQEAANAAYEAYKAAALAMNAAEAAYKAAFKAYNAEMDRIDKEYPL